MHGKGYAILLCGSKKHPENIGTISYCGNYVFVIEKEEDSMKAIQYIEKIKAKKVVLLSQTTFSLEKFYIIEEILKNELPRDIQLVVDNTICKATELRQKETEDLAKKVECMIIIGGKNSSNTKKLYEIAKKYCINTVLVETAKELQNYKMEKCSKIGVMAGASTPQKSIQDVVDSLNLYYQIMK